jgi:hypothetical protein
MQQEEEAEDSLVARGAVPLPGEQQHVPRQPSDPFKKHNGLANHFALPTKPSAPNSYANVARILLSLIQKAAHFLKLFLICNFSSASSLKRQLRVHKKITRSPFSLFWDRMTVRS